MKKEVQKQRKTTSLSSINSTSNLTSNPTNNLLFPIITSIILQIILIYLAKSQLYFIITQNHYLLFHTITELFSIIIGFIIFYYAQKSYHQTKSEPIRLIGLSFLLMAIIDILHTIAYSGFPNLFFTPSGNAGIWFWLPARFIGALTLVIASLSSLFDKKISPKQTTSPHLITLSNLTKLYSQLAIIFTIIIIPLTIYNTFNEILPKMFIQDIGLTTLKIVSEYFVTGLFTLSALIYLKVLSKNRSKTLMYFIIGLFTSVFSEIAFTMYTNVFDIFNMLGHVLKIIAYLMFILGLFYGLKGTKK